MIKTKWVKEKELRKDYKGFIGDSKKYDDIGQIIYTMLIENGLKKHHFLLDIGCGSLRVGKLLIPHLYRNRYYGIEPNYWLIKEAIEKELTISVFEKKAPSFGIEKDFNLSEGKIEFDFILANSIFIHACKFQVEKCIDEAVKILRKGGKFIFNFIPGKDSKTNEWSYPGSVTYSREYIERLLSLRQLKWSYFDVKYPGKQLFIKIEG